jgi:hypothetical protein
MQLLDLHQNAELGRHHQARSLPAAGRQGRTDRLSFGSNSVHHTFCKYCGVRPFGTGHIPAIGGDYVAIQVATLDDATAAELIAAPTRYSNGRDNAWREAPAETRHL